MLRGKVETVLNILKTFFQVSILVGTKKTNVIFITYLYMKARHNFHEFKIHWRIFHFVVVLIHCYEESHFLVIRFFATTEGGKFCPTLDEMAV